MVNLESKIENPNKKIIEISNKLYKEINELIPYYLSSIGISKVSIMDKRSKDNSDCFIIYLNPKLNKNQKNILKEKYRNYQGYQIYFKSNNKIITK